MNTTKPTLGTNTADSDHGSGGASLPIPFSSPFFKDKTNNKLNKQMIAGTIIIEDNSLNFRWIRPESDSLMEVTICDNPSGLQVCVEVDGDDFAKTLVLALSPSADEGMKPETAEELYEAGERIMALVMAESVNKYGEEKRVLRFIP
jgi:hypothetical protein